MRGTPDSNAVLLKELYALMREGETEHSWSKAAGLSHNYFTMLKGGSEPSVYKIERLVKVRGMSLSRFWRRVEAARKVEAAEGGVSE